MKIIYKKEIFFKIFVIIIFILITTILFINNSKTKEEIEMLKNNIENLEIELKNNNQHEKIEEIKKIIERKSELKKEKINNPRKLKKSETQDLISEINYLAKNIEINNLDFEKVGENFLVFLKVETEEINYLYNYLISIKKLNYAFDNKVIVLNEDESELEFNFYLNSD